MRRAVLAALAAAGLVVVPVGPSSAVGPAVPGGAGTDTSLPATDSQVTVRGRDRFKDLEITVNQTRDLVDQAISVTWKGGTTTTRAQGEFGGNYLQIFQCWGDDDGTVLGNPGPPPEQCEQGASEATYGRVSSIFPNGSSAGTRVIGRTGDPNFAEVASQGVVDSQNGVGMVWKPFRPVDGQTVDVAVDAKFNPIRSGGSYWLNPFFNSITTNEIAAARTAAGETGAELFEATTGDESPGLGCGKMAQSAPDGSRKMPRCWLVIVPRASSAEENVGTAYSGSLADFPGVMTSPLSPNAWRNRIAVPLEFNALEGSCPIGADPRQLAGGELLAPAVASWQPVLCATPGLPPYGFAGSIGDEQARQQLLSGIAGAPGLAVGSRPIDPDTTDPQNPVVYAPLSLSGTVIGFNLERPAAKDQSSTADPALAALKGVRVAELNLSPRLVAKLLTQSYSSQAGSRAQHYAVPGNPMILLSDPDFLQFNPEFTLLGSALDKDLAGLVVAGPASDAALQVWEWVLSDPEAKAWMNGQPDQWGMKVNPVYGTAADANPNGTAFGEPLPDTYPKSDQFCYQAPMAGQVVPPPLCGNDWLPYTSGIGEAARRTRTANDGSRTAEDTFAVSPDKYFKPDGPDLVGSRLILSITDSASAARYGIQSARLSRAGDNGADRRFVAPDEPGLVAGLRSMAPRAVSTVVEPNPTADAPGAYPLAALTYGAVAPLGLDAQARKEYAAFVDYAAGPGQVPGLKLGQLPRGYAPLPPDLRAQATAAATAIRDLRALDPEADPEADAAPGGGEEGAAPSPGGFDGSGDPGASETGGTPGTGDAPLGTPPGPPSGSPAESNPIARIAKTLLTPIERLAASRFLLPVLAVLAATAALGALEISKRSRRARRADPLPAVAPGGTWALPGPTPADQPSPPPPADPPKPQSGPS